MRFDLSHAFLGRTSSFELLDKPEVTPPDASGLRGLLRRSIKRRLKMLGELLDSIGVEAGEGITMRFDVPERSVEAIFCPASIRRVVDNLVSTGQPEGSRWL